MPVTAPHPHGRHGRPLGERETACPRRLVARVPGHAGSAGRREGGRVARPRVLVLVMAGGAGGRLELLTDHRAKPAVPFGGSYRLIDFPLTNCLHSGLDDVWV